MKEIFLWYEMYIKGNYNQYCYLKEKGICLSMLYEWSKKENILKEQLMMHHVTLPFSQYKRVLEDRLKSECQEKMKHLKENQMDVLTIEEKEYPEELKNLKHIPLILLIKGNRECFLRTKVMMWNEVLDAYGKSVYEYYTSWIRQNKIALVSDRLEKDSNILVLDQIPTHFECHQDQVLMYLSKSEIEEMKITLSKCLIIPQASYGEKINRLVDYFLEKGKDIYVTPNPIWSKEAYFSNYLIKQGANVLICAKEIGTTIQ